MSARSVCSGTRPSRYHSVRAISAPPKRHAALELLGDALGNEVRIGLGLAHLDDVDVHLAVGEGLHLGADLVDVSALLADHDARTGGVDRHAAFAVRTLDDHLADGGLLEVLEQRRANLEVFLEQVAVLALVGEPAAVP